MRKIEELVGIIGSYNAVDIDKHIDLFNQLSTQEMQMCVDHYGQFKQGSIFFTMSWRVPFVMEIKRRVTEERNKKLNKLGI